jgi:hypothetical protein
MGYLLLYALTELPGGGGLCRHSKLEPTEYRSKLLPLDLSFSIKQGRVTSVYVDIGNVYIALNSYFFIRPKRMLTQHVRNKKTQTTLGVSKDITVQTAAQETNQCCMFILRHQNL